MIALSACLGTWGVSVHMQEPHLKLPFHVRATLGIWYGLIICAVCGPVVMLRARYCTALAEMWLCKHHYSPFCRDSTVTMSTSFLLPDFCYKGPGRLQKWIWQERNRQRAMERQGGLQFPFWCSLKGDPCWAWGTVWNSVFLSSPFP